MRYEKAVKLLVSRADEKRYSQAEIATGSNLSPAQISRIFNYESTPSQESLVAIAKFLDIPAEEILTVAGLLSPKPGPDQLRDTIVRLFDQLPTDEDKNDVEEYIRLRLRIAEERSKYETHPKKLPSKP